MKFVQNRVRLFDLHGHRGWTRRDPSGNPNVGAAIHTRGSEGSLGLNVPKLTYDSHAELKGDASPSQVELWRDFQAGGGRGDNC